MSEELQITRAYPVRAYQWDCPKCNWSHSIEYRECDKRHTCPNCGQLVVVDYPDSHTPPDDC